MEEMKHHHCDCSMDEHEHHEHHEHHGCGCHHHHHEEGSLKSKLYLIGVTIILLIVAVFIEKHYDLATWQLLLVYLIPYLLIGHETLGEAAEGIAKGDMFNEHFLMAIATIGALCIGFFPGSETEFPEAVFVMLFFQVGELFEGYAEGKSRDSISHLMDIRPDVANVIRNGEVESVAPDTVKIGETILIKRGEKIPLDGIVVEGSALLDTVALTGESVPRAIKDGDEIYSGCINLKGELKVRTTKTFGESTASKIIALVESADRNKSKSEAFITRFARIYTPIVVFAALALAIIPPMLGAMGIATSLMGGGTFGENFPLWLNRALIFLVVSCPCALVISVPLTFFGGIGGASRNGILIKGSNYMDALAKIGTVVFDKTGTLTHGEVLVQADEGAPVVVNDGIKEGSAEAVRCLKALGVKKTVMLTGDHEEIGKKVAGQVGVDEYYAKLLPADKVTHLEKLLKTKPAGKTLAYVGDGINDAPVLKRADVGIAMGALGSDAAIDAADVVLMDDDPRKIALAMKIARHTIHVAHENVIFAIAVKMAVLVLATIGLGSMWMAVFADVGVTVLAVLNAMRTLKKSR
jgi:cation transport ATPase